MFYNFFSSFNKQEEEVKKGLFRVEVTRSCTNSSTYNQQKVTNKGYN